MKIACFGVNSFTANVIQRLDFKIDLLVVPQKSAFPQNDIFSHELFQSGISTEIYHSQSYGLKNRADFEYIADSKADLGIVLFWNRLIPAEVLKLFPMGCIGFHGTPYKLPKGRGRSPVVWTLLRNKKIYYYYLLKLLPGVDDGPFYDVIEIDVNPFDDINSMYKKLVIAAALMCNKNVPLILSGRSVLTQQADEEPSYFEKREYSDGEIDWDCSDLEVYGLVRAITEPYPCAHTFNKESEIKIISVKPFTGGFFNNAKPGTVLDIFSDGTFLVKCGTGTVIVTLYKSVSPIQIGDQFGSKSK